MTFGQIVLDIIAILLVLSVIGWIFVPNLRKNGGRPSDVLIKKGKKNKDKKLEKKTKGL